MLTEERKRELGELFAGRGFSRADALALLCPTLGTVHDAVYSIEVEDDPDDLGEPLAEERIAKEPAMSQHKAALASVTMADDLELLLKAFAERVPEDGESTGEMLLLKRIREDLKEFDR